MRPILPISALLVLLCSVTISAWSADNLPGVVEARIAKVDMNELESDLRDVVLAKPENAALKKDIEAGEALDDKRNKAMQAASQAGKDVQAVLKDLPTSDGKAQQKLERLVKAELLKFVVKKYGKRFVVVLDSNYGDSVIYLDGELVDITQSIRQAMQLNEF